MGQAVGAGRLTFPGVGGRPVDEWVEAIAIPLFP
jgi:hypothetical protein